MLTQQRAVSAQELVRDWATEHSHVGTCDAHLAPTSDHKIIITATDSRNWLELPGDDSEHPLSRTERERIVSWLSEKLPATQL